MSHPTNGPVPLQNQDNTPAVDVSTGEILGDAHDPGAAPFSTQSYSAVVPPPRMRMAVGGEYAAIVRRTGPDPRPREWRRGTVKRFSPRSRSRMLQKLAQTDTRYLEGRAWFITLTWPREWVRLPYRWKEMLETWRKRLMRLYPNAWYFWKLEFQQRGAPHFHLLMFGPERLDAWQLHENWYRIVGSTQKAHWTYGTDVKMLREWRQVNGYCSKYAAKVDESTDTDGVGRYWGIGSRANRVETIVEGEVSDDEFFRIRRVFKRLIMAANGYHRAGGPNSGVWVRCSNETAKRVLAWAASTPDDALRVSSELGLVTPCDHDRPLACSDASSRSRQHDGRPNPTVRTSGKTNIPMYDADDLQRRRAMRALN